MNAEKLKEHEWLERLVGSWSAEFEMTSEPGTPPTKHEGRETVRSLGGLWVLCEGSGESPEGTQASSVMTLGYDPARSRFVGTFIASVMTHLWVYYGELDSQKRTLVLDTEGPAFSGEGMAKYQDIIELRSDDHRLLRSRLLRENGEWVEFMVGNYHRVR